MISRREQLVVGQARNTSDNGVEVRVSCMIVLTPAAAAVVCLVASRCPVAGRKTTCFLLSE